MGKINPHEMTLPVADNVPLSRDQTSQIMGISSSRSGLCCRADVMCRFSARVDKTIGAMALAAGLRNEHELSQHRYIHVPLLTTTFAYTDKISARGRTTLGKKGHHAPGMAR